MLEQIKAVYPKEKQEEKKDELLSVVIYKKVSDDIEAKKSAGNYKYFWADLYCDKKLGNFTEVFEYINDYYKVSIEYGFNDFMRHRYKTLSTELHSNILQIRNIDSNYYASNYSGHELFLVMDSLILFDTIFGDFLNVLITKYTNVLKLADQKRIKGLRSDLLRIILSEK